MANILRRLEISLITSDIELNLDLSKTCIFPFSTGENLNIRNTNTLCISSNCGIWGEISAFTAFEIRLLNDLHTGPKLRYPKNNVRSIFVYLIIERGSGLFVLDFSYTNNNIINWCYKYQYYLPSQEIKYHQEIFPGILIFEHLVRDNKNTFRAFKKFH